MHLERGLEQSSDGSRTDCRAWVTRLVVMATRMRKLESIVVMVIFLPAKHVLEFRCRVLLGIRARNIGECSGHVFPVPAPRRLACIRPIAHMGGTKSSFVINSSELHYNVNLQGINCCSRLQLLFIIHYVLPITYYLLPFG